jgi:hypothetical protein
MLVYGLYSLGTDPVENTSWEHPKETPIVMCLAITKEHVLPLLTHQAYSVHVTIFKNNNNKLKLHSLISEDHMTHGECLLPFGSEFILCLLSKKPNISSSSSSSSGLPFEGI